jgi:thioesterase III
MSVWKKQSYELLVRESHLDTYGHMNNATYLSVLEEARWEFITAGGYGFDRIHKTQEGPIVLDVHLSFKKELKLREKIKIESVVLEYTGKVGRLEQKILNSEGVECAVAIFTIGFFDMKARKLILPTPDWLKAIGAAQ